MNDTITLPRAWLEELVDPKVCNYVDSEYGTCRYCSTDQTWLQQPHATTCPVRLVQEALKEHNE